MVTVTADTGTTTTLEAYWAAPSDAGSRTVTYETMFADLGTITTTNTSNSYHYLLPIARFTNFMIRATTPDGAVSEWVEVLAAAFGPHGDILVLNNKILVINNKILHIEDS